jgi:hypothetical protein
MKDIKKVVIDECFSEEEKNVMMNFLKEEELVSVERLQMINVNDFNGQDLMALCRCPFIDKLKELALPKNSEVKADDVKKFL